MIIHTSDNHLINQVDRLTSDNFSFDQLSDSYEPELALFCRFYLLIRSSNQKFEFEKFQSKFELVEYYLI
jgi:hypothetical protein